MTERTYTRQTFMIQLAAGFAALATGCDSDDGDGTGTDTDSTDPTTASTTQTNSTGSTTNPDPTDPTDPTGQTTATSSTTDPETSSSGGADTGSSSGGGSSGSSGDQARACSGAVIVAEISLNHGHELEIPVADIMAGVETSYDADGTSGHCHRVVMTSEDFATLRAGGSVTKISCNGGDHEYVLSCEFGAKPPGDPAKECEQDGNAGSCN